MTEEQVCEYRTNITNENARNLGFESAEEQNALIKDALALLERLDSRLSAHILNA